MNFDDADEFVLDSSIFGSEYDTITYYAREKDLDLTMTMEAAAGGPPSNSHGEGGTSTVRLLHTKNVEHTVLGTTNNKAIFLYRGSNLLCVCGQGGQQGTGAATPLAGGAGGGVDVSGQGGTGGGDIGRHYGSQTPAGRIRPQPTALSAAF